jgi:hypothetical protein
MLFLCRSWQFNQEGKQLSQTYIAGLNAFRQFVNLAETQAKPPCDNLEYDTSRMAIERLTLVPR